MENMKTDQKGFTLIEILVVVLIIGIIGTLAAVAVNAARSKARDATRLSSVRQTQSALEDYYNELNTYPPGSGLPLGDSTQSSCFGTNGFASNCSSADRTFLRVVSGSIDKGLEGVVTCGEPARNAFCYSMLESGLTYGISFELENGLPQVGLIAGINCASPDGMKAGACN